MSSKSRLFLWLKRLLVVGVVGFVVLAGLFWRAFLNDPFNDWWFEEKIWKAKSNTDGGLVENPRGKMVYDLRHRVLQPKMTRKQVVALLGRGDVGESDTSLSYYIGWWSGFRMDPDIFVVEFDKAGRLVESYWYHG